MLGGCLRRICAYFIAIFVCCGLYAGVARANSEGFGHWLEAFRREALAKGVSEKTVRNVLTSEIRPISRILELDRAQPESRLSFAQYKANTITEKRISRGRALESKYAQDLREIEQAYGVQRSYILALWGMETDFGRNTGGFSVVEALATLAYEGRRSDFFRSELLHALKILDDGHIVASRMKGSWAGAMGQSQFMPSSFLKFAVDYNGDGKRDIWYSEGDVFASIANYLSKSGWKRDQRWGRHVLVPATGIHKDLIGLEVRKPLSFWRELGIMAADGHSLPDVPGMEASLVYPDGKDKAHAYLAYDNYRVLMQWNKSRYFATSVGLLADRM